MPKLRPIAAALGFFLVNSSICEAQEHHRWWHLTSSVYRGSKVFDRCATDPDWALQSPAATYDHLKAEGYEPKITDRGDSVEVSYRREDVAEYVLTFFRNEATCQTAAKINREAAEERQKEIDKYR